MTVAREKIFAEALARDEVPAFLAGDGPYFVDARTPDEHEEPQHVEAAFDLLVLPLWTASRDAAIPSALVAGLLRLLAAHPDPNRAAYAASSWIWYALYCQDRQRKHPTGRYGGLFAIDFTPVAAPLKAVIETRKDALVADTRWAGAAWNSPDGLWTPLVRTALAVRDRLAGPDFVPANA